MRKYYLFLIRDDIKDNYINSEENLYSILYEIYKLNLDNIYYGISIYNQICNVFDKEIINNYLKNKNKKFIKCINNKFFINDIKIHEKSCIQVNNSCIVIKSNCNYPNSLKIFRWYSFNIFICDFENKDYFWIIPKNEKIKSYS